MRILQSTETCEAFLRGGAELHEKQEGVAARSLQLGTWRCL